MKFSKLKYNILCRKHLLNLLLLSFSPTNKLIVALSQSLDKYIVLYQKQCISKCDNKQYSSKFITDIAA